MPIKSVPTSEEATAILRFLVESEVYGLQFDMILNHAYRQGTRARPNTQITVTTLLLNRLTSERMTAEIFEVVFLKVFIFNTSFLP